MKQEDYEFEASYIVCQKIKRKEGKEERRGEERNLFKRGRDIWVEVV
jgi:hypothetical protein